MAVVSRPRRCRAEPAPAARRPRSAAAAEPGSDECGARGRDSRSGWRPATTGGVEPEPRTFTRAEADAMLPEVDRLLAEAQSVADLLGNAEQAAQSEQF